MPPVIATLAVTAGVFVLGRALKREWDRINRELDAEELRVTVPVETLRRDPVTGEWRAVRR